MIFEETGQRVLTNVLHSVTIVLHTGEKDGMRINELQWDDINIEHIEGGHNITVKEVEDVCFEEHIVFPARNQRYVVYGQANNGKYLMVILESLYGSIFRPITAREMTESEKKNYRKRLN
ncbi:hypothetical protein ACFLVW_08135 [Chloroflexota bacterium]